MAEKIKAVILNFNHKGSMTNHLPQATIFNTNPSDWTATRDIFLIQIDVNSVIFSHKFEYFCQAHICKVHAHGRWGKYFEK